MTCFDCGQGPCYMNCGPAVAPDRNSPVKVFTIRHRQYGSLHGSGDYAPDAPFFSTRALAERDCMQYEGDFEIVELKEAT